MNSNSVISHKFLPRLKNFLTGDFGLAIPPFLVSRILIIAIGLFSFYFQPSPDYPMAEEAMRGYGWTSVRILDMFERYDSGWYLSIIEDGYHLKGELGEVQSNINFLPLYPLLVKFLGSIINGGDIESMLFSGILLSNLFFLLSLIFIRKLIKTSGYSQEVSTRVIWYLCFFPTSFYLSSFYTEALFLFLSIILFYFAVKGKWLFVGLVGFLISITRVTGILAALSTAVFYMEKINWDFRKIRWNILWLGLAPIGLLTFLFGILHITGELFAPFTSQSAWNHVLSFPWTSIFSDLNFRPFITTIDQVLVISFIILSIISLIKLPSKAYGIYCLLSMSAFLFSGTILAASRYLLVLFPGIWLPGVWGKNRSVDRIIMAALLYSSFFS